MERVVHLFQPKKLKETVIFVTLLMTSIGLSFIISENGVFTGIVSIVLFVLAGLFVRTVIDLRFGFFLMITYGYFLFLLDRLFPLPIPYGTGIEIIQCVMLVTILTQGRNFVSWDLFRNPVTYWLLITEAYNVLQVFNPYAVSMSGWVYSTRGIIFTLILYFIVVIVLSDFSIVKKFTKYWLGLALLAGMYGIYQEIFGYSDFEWRSIYSNPQTYGLIAMWTGIRKFSFLSDVSAFGMLMAFAGIFCCVLALGPYKVHIRITLVVSAILMFIGMTYSGTRTATAMLPVGVVFYALMSINNIKTWIFLSAFVIILCAILFGPFYSGPFQRIKSTFQPSDDPSMQVRDKNRQRIQPYVLSHPIGGGVFTTGDIGHVYSPGHYLAGFQPDSGYLKTALERGWIGLILLLALYFVIMKEGLTNYYRSQDPEIRIFYAAYLCAFFSLTIANFAQASMTQKPIGLIVISIYALMPNMIKFER